MSNIKIFSHSQAELDGICVVMWIYLNIGVIRVRDLNMGEESLLPIVLLS